MWCVAGQQQQQPQEQQQDQQQQQQQQEHRVEQAPPPAAAAPPTEPAAEVSAEAAARLPLEPAGSEGLRIGACSCLLPACPTMPVPHIGGHCCHPLPCGPHACTATYLAGFLRLPLHLLLTEPIRTELTQ